MQSSTVPYSLQRHNAKNLSPNFHIHVSLSNFYIPTIDLPIFCYRKYVDGSWEYINRSQTHEF
jgi:hypothetical protein